MLKPDTRLLQHDGVTVPLGKGTFHNIYKSNTAKSSSSAVEQVNLRLDDIHLHASRRLLPETTTKLYLWLKDLQVAPRWNTCVQNLLFGTPRQLYNAPRKCNFQISFVFSQYVIFFETTTWHNLQCNKVRERVVTKNELLDEMTFGALK